MSEQTKRTYSEIDFNHELSLYFFKEYDAEGKFIESYENFNRVELEKLRKNLIAQAEGKKHEKKEKAPSKKKQRESEIDEIDSMMQAAFNQLDGPGKDEHPENALPDRPISPPYNFPEKRQKAETQAKGLLKELLKFYLSDEFISENAYIKAKIAIDQMTLSGLINQIQLSEAAIQRLMESIDSGESHPRMFEVLAGMQRVYIDLTKMQALSVIATEEHMKKLKTDFDYYQGGSTIEMSKKELPEEGETVRGTRDFLKDLQNEGEDDVDFEE